MFSPNVSSFQRHLLEHFSETLPWLCLSREWELESSPSESHWKRAWKTLQERFDALRMGVLRDEVWRLVESRILPMESILSNKWKWDGAPLWRVSLQESTVLFQASPLVLDPSSLELLRDELLTLLSLYQQGVEVEPVEDDLGLVEVIEWLQELEEAEETERSRQWWENHPLSWSTGSHRHLKQTPATGYRVSTASRFFSQAENPFLQSDSFQEENCSFVWSRVLAQWTETTKGVLEVETAGRFFEDLEEIVGCLDVPLPLSWDASQPFDQSSLETWKNQLESAREAIDGFFWPSKETRFPSLVQRYGFCFRPQQTVTNGGLLPYQALLQLHTTKAGWDVSVQVNESLVDGRWAEILLQRWWKGMQCFAESQPLSLPEEELKCLLQQGEGAAFVEQTGATILSRLAQVVRENAGSPALWSAAEEWTYGQLWDASTHLASRLVEAGAEGRRVALCMPRRPEWFVGLLAIVRAGASYLPLDSKSPPSRLSVLLEDAQPVLVLTDETFPLQDAGLPVWNIEDAPATSSTDVTLPMAAPEAEAYLLYTSGTTGTPKGVSITHRQLWESTLARMQRYADQPVSRFLLLSPGTFDSSVAGIFWTMAQGGVLCLPAPGEERDPVILAELLSSQQISHLLCLPSLLRLLLEEERDLSSLQCIIVAGESCPSSLPAAVRTKLPSVRLFNEYGPTENTVWTTSSELTKHSSEDSISIGKPRTGTSVAVVSPEGELVGFGEKGELWIRGGTLTRGYWNRPEENQKRFVQKAFSGQKSYRWYRSGDLVSWRLDGELDFHGRLDEQVKVRGVRMELQEIEQALRSVEGIEEAAVVPELRWLPHREVEILEQLLSKLPEHRRVELLQQIQNDE